MAFNDAALERALRAETKGGLTLCGGVSELTVIGCGWMAVIPEIELRDRLRGTLGALVEMLGYIPGMETVQIMRSKGAFVVNTVLPEVVGEEIAGYIVEEDEEEIRPTGLRLGLDFLMQKKTGEIVGVTQRGKSGRAPVCDHAGRDRPAGGRRHRRAAVPPRLSPERGHGQRGDAPKVAASGSNELVRLGRAGGIKTRRIKTWISKMHSRQ